LKKFYIYDIIKLGPQFGEINRKEVAVMEKATKKRQLAFQLFVATMATIIMVIITVFFFGVCDYMSATRKISHIQSEAEKSGYYTAGGWKSGWTKERQLRYEDAVEEKMELVKSSDVAQWCYEAANTLTGIVVRALAITGSIVIWICSAFIIIYIIVTDINYLRSRHRA